MVKWIGTFLVICSVFGALFTFTHSSDSSNLLANDQKQKPNPSPCTFCNIKIG